MEVRLEALLAYRFRHSDPLDSQREEGDRKHPLWPDYIIIIQTHVALLATNPLLAGIPPISFTDYIDSRAGGPGRSCTTTAAPSRATTPSQSPDPSRDATLQRINITSSKTRKGIDEDEDVDMVSLIFLRLDVNSV